MAMAMTDAWSVVRDRFDAKEIFGDRGAEFHLERALTTLSCRCAGQPSPISQKPGNSFSAGGWDCA
eukprot:4638710-Amphidinium_carterae.1